MHGKEPWVTDGTSGGTRLLADIWPGTIGSVAPFHSMVATDGGVYFVANDGVHGAELWFSDGTTVGTQMVRDIAVGRDDGIPIFLTMVGNRLFFVANEPSVGRELWVSDGTSAGTRLVVDLAPGPASPTMVELAACGSLLIMTVDDGIHGDEPWVSDGTAAGTRLLRDLYGGVARSYPRQFTTAGERVFFIASTPFANLWSTDGTTAGTRQVTGLFASLDQGYHVVSDGGLYFVGGLGTYGELWFTNATTATIRLTAPGFSVGGLQRTDQGLIFGVTGFTGLHRLDRSSPTGFTQIYDQPLAEIASDGTRHGWFRAQATVAGRIRAELWRTDGTAAGTLRVADLHPYAYPTPVVAIHGRVLYVAEHPVAGRELWVMDDLASARPFGTGCTDRIMPRELRATGPVLGGTLKLSGTGAVAACTILFSLPIGRPSRVGGCSVYVSPIGLTSLASFPAQGFWELSVPLPAEPALQGLSLTMQALHGPTATPLGSDLTNPIDVTFGN